MGEFFEFTGAIQNVALPPAAAAPPRPTVFIGLGGTGLKILARLRRLIYDRFGDPDYWKILAFLAIDTNQADLKSGGVVNNQGLPINNADRQSIGLTANEVNKLRDELHAKFSYMDPWLSDEAKQKGDYDFTAGAGQRRSIGRALFAYHLDEIRGKLAQRCRAVTSMEAIEDARGKHAPVEDAQGQNRNIPVDIWIVSSLAGGTGAGAFLDCAYLAQDLQTRNEATIAGVRGMLVLPDVFRDEVERDKPGELPVIYANAYTALCELEYRNKLSNPDFSQADWGRDPKPIHSEPFQACYLFSKSNGQPLASGDAVYDLVADALAFSVMGTTLADDLRGSWSNAQAGAYQIGWKYELVDRPRNRHPYLREWSTRYSSLGIASISLKLPELARLAAVRLLRRAFQEEHGVVPGGTPGLAPPDLHKNAEITAAPFSTRPNFVDRTGVQARIAAARDKRTASEAKAAAQMLTGTLHAIAMEVESNPAAPKIPMVRNLVEKVHRQANDAIANARKNIPGLSSGRYAEIVALLREVIERLREQRQDPGPLPDPEFKCGAIEQWQDLDDHRIIDPLGLGMRAMKIIRRKFEGRLHTHCGLYLNRINTTLVNLYQDLICERLDNLRETQDRAVGSLADWEGDSRQGLVKIQNDIAAHFDDNRNEVLTSHLRCSAGGPNEHLLDAEIDLAIIRKLGRLGKPAVGPEELRQIRRLVLDKLGLPEPPTTFLGAKQMGVTLEDLIKVTARELLDRLPADRNIYSWLGRRPDVDGLVDQASGRAMAYWPIADGGANYLTVTSASFLWGAVEVPDDQPANRAVQHRVQMRLAAKGWRMRTTPPGSPGASEGELVLVNERHGLALPSLQIMPEMIKFYCEVRDGGRVADRHVDVRLIGKLPDLAETSYQSARKEMAAWDMALMGIVLGLLPWDESSGQYTHVPKDSFRPSKIGRSFVEVAQWFLRPRNEEESRRLGNRVRRWFVSRIEDRLLGIADEDQRKQAAAKLAREFTEVDMVLYLLNRHCYPPTEVGNITYHSPETSLVLRLTEETVQDHMRALEAECDGLDGLSEILNGRALRAKVIPGLHRTVRFVGPRPPEGTDRKDVRPEHRQLRILQYLDRASAPALPDGASEQDPGQWSGSDKDPGRPVLDEAFELDWFPNLRVKRELAALFPDYTEASD